MSQKQQIIKRLIDVITEGPIDYGDRPERMSQDHEQNLAQKQTTFSNHPAMPKVDPEGIPSDYPEVMASKRFRDVVNDVIRFTGIDPIPSGDRGLLALQKVLMSVVYKILELEDGHREELEKLAVELVKTEFGIRDDDYQWDCKIIDLRNPEQQEEMQQKIQDMNQEEQEEAEEEAIDTLNDIELERYKRRFINAMVQGSAQKMNQSYYLVQDRLTAIHPDMLNLYGAMMAINDLQYWIMPDEMIQMMAAGGSGAGTEEVSKETDPPTIKARGINFPVLVHEITKAVMDAIGTHGLPDDPVEAKAIMDAEDTLEKEAWDLRLGPVIWEKFRDAYPDTLYDEDKRRIHAYLIHTFVQIPSDEFMQVAKDILSGSARGKRQLQEIVNGILEELNREALEDVENQYSDEEGGEAPDESKPGWDPLDPSTW